MSIPKVSDCRLPSVMPMRGSSLTAAY